MKSAIEKAADKIPAEKPCAQRTADRVVAEMRADARRAKILQWRARNTGELSPAFAQFRESPDAINEEIYRGRAEEKANLTDTGSVIPFPCEQKHELQPKQINGEIKTDPPERFKPKLELVTLADAIKGETATFQVGTLIERGDKVYMFGPGGSAKTLGAIDFGLRLARGEPWLGMDTVKGKVLYIAAEADRSARRRIAAYCKARGIDAAGVDFRIIKRPVNFFADRKDVDEIVGLLKAGDFWPLDVVIVDTQARTMPGADENSAKDAGVWISHTDVLRELCGDPTLILVAHTGKDQERGLRGSSAFYFNCEVALVYSKNKDEMHFTISVDRARDTAPGTCWKCIVNVEDIDWGGTTLEMAWADWDGHDPTVHKKGRKPSSDQEKVAIRALKNLLASDGARRVLPGTSGFPSTGCKAVKLTDWKDEACREGFYPKTKMDEPITQADFKKFKNAERTAFNRMAGRLRTRGTINMYREHDDAPEWVWHSEYVQKS